MAVVIQKAEELGSAVRRIFHLLYPSGDSGEGSALSEVLGKPTQIGGELIYNDLSLIQDLSRVDYQTGDDLIETAATYGVPISTGQYAWTDLTFFAATAPTLDIVIPTTNRVGTTSDDLEAPTEYAVQTSNTMLVSQLSNYYVPDRGRYEIQARVQALDPGTRANVAKTLINQVLDPITGIDGCTNYGDVTGGLDGDSEATIRNNIKLAILGKILTTEEGLQKFGTANQWGYAFGFADTRVVNVNNVLSERPTGSDLFAISSSVATTTQVVNYTGGVIEIPLVQRPVLAVSQIVSANLLGALTPGVHYEFHRDSSSVYRLSMRSLDHVLLLGGWPVPDTLTITYSYADQIQNCQNTLGLSKFQANADNVLAKKAIEYLLYMQARLSFFANVDISLQKQLVEQAFSTSLSAYKLGDPLQGSDMEIVLQQGYGDYPVTSVDQVVLVNWWAVDEFGNSYTPTDEEIALNIKEYARLGSLVFV